MKKGGTIVNITADLHHCGTLYQTHAGTAKAGVDAMTKHLAVELGPKGIRVIGISPGVIANTEGFEKLSMGDVHSQQSIIPLQRFGNPEDIANCAVFMCTDAASYITGQTIGVNGGNDLTCQNFPFLSEEVKKKYGKPKL